MNIAHTHTVRVYYADTDAGGVVHHTAYLRFFEQARTEALRQAGIELQDLQKNYGIMFAIKTMQIAYLKPARLDDLLCVETKVLKMGRASLLYQQTIYLAEQKDCIICTAEIKLVCVNAMLQPCALPNILKKMESG